MTALSDAFFEQLADLGERHATDPVVFLDVWNAESGLNPSAENPASHARGLNQMMPKTLAGLGAPAVFSALPGEAQIPWIERLIAGGEILNGGPFRSAERYYHSNFFPRTMPRGDAPSTIVVASDAADPEERAAYAANVGMDRARKGRITYEDLAAFLTLAKTTNRATYEEARARLALAMRGGAPLPVARRPVSAASAVFTLASVVSLAIAWRSR